MFRNSCSIIGSNRVNSVPLRPKKGAFFAPFLLVLCFFAFAFAPVQGRRLNGQTYDCDLECDIGETCVPYGSPSFGTLLAHRHSGTLPFRCQGLKEEALLASANRAVDDDFQDDDFLEDFLLAPDECPYDCQNGGKCISIFGGLSFACICVEPYWGSECELDGLEETCELDCSSIAESAASGNSSISDDDYAFSPPPTREGAFCVESPENEANSVEDQTCVHCEEISPQDEPNCQDLIDCKNGGICKMEYQFVSAALDDSDNSNDGSNTAATFDRPLKCSSSTWMPIVGTDGSTSMQTVWMELPPYILSCDCLPGFQGETCEEIDVCGTGCQNNGYCISNETHGEMDFDDFFNFNTDDSIYDDDFNFDLNDDDNDNFGDDIFDDDNDGTSNDDDDDQLIVPAHSNQVDCTCMHGACHQASCGNGASCIGGLCNQDNLSSPTCSGGKCSQRHSRNPSCSGGDCDQTAAVQASCGGEDCFFDDVEAQTLIPNTDTMEPFQPFCSCEYGYFGDLCQHTITAICLFDDLSYNQLLHEVCLKLGGLCPLDVGDRFCTNGGTCGNTNATDIIAASELYNNDFSCDCPIGFEGIHCEILVGTPAPSPASTARQPTASHTIEPSSSSPRGLFPQKSYMVVVFNMLSSITVLLVLS